MKDLEQATGVGRESIRFYIREGLLPEPERPARNVAFYDDSYIERIRFIKELQQKRYLPLQVIKAIVAADATPSRAEIDTLLALDGKLFPSVQAAPVQAGERLRQLATRVGLSVREIRGLAAAGAIDVVRREGEEWLEDSAVHFVEIWARLRAAGFTAQFGFEHLRLCIDTVRWLAHEELRLFVRDVAGHVPNEQAAHMAEQGIDLANQLLGLLRKQTLLHYVATGNVADEGISFGARPFGPGRTSDGTG
jgi:DNA-binding transcriptional MerR regulator